MQPEHAERPFPLISEHVLLSYAGSILDAHRRLEPRVDAGVLAQIAALVPPAWFVGEAAETYADYLVRRARSGAFAEEAERARRSA